MSTDWCFETGHAESAPAQGAHKVRAVAMAEPAGSTREETLNSWILNAQTAETVRNMSGAVYVTLTLRTIFVASSIAAIKKFNEETKEISKHGKGHPHIQGYAAFLHCILAQGQTLEDVHSKSPRKHYKYYKPNSTV